jgi:hypothetical protein
MCEPKDLKQRVDAGNFELFPLAGLKIYIQKDLVSPGVIEFSIPDEGAFSAELVRAAPPHPPCAR